MNKEVIRPIRGMKDLYGPDFDKYQYIIEMTRKVATKYGYQGIETPMVENTEIFQRSLGDETDVVSKEMYTFLDKGNESITLRPEGTAGVMRAIVSNNLILSTNTSLKLMYYGPMFRYDRPQKGRYRQFHQLGFEHLGEKSPYTDVITIALAHEILNAIGIFNYKILINTLGDKSSRDIYTQAIVKYFSMYEDKLSEDSKIRLRRNPLRILDSKDHSDKELSLMAPKINDYLSKENIKYFECVCKLLSEYGIQYEIDSLLVRGLDYYSHTTFEIKLNEAQYKDAIGGGGRYDNLLGMFGGPDISGVGFAFGIERLMMLLNNDRVQKSPSKIAVIPVSDNELNSAFELFKNILSNDISAEFIHIDSSLRKKVETASKVNSKVLLIIGGDEIKNNTVSVTVMDSEDKTERNTIINRHNVINYLKYILIQ